MMRPIKVLRASVAHGILDPVQCSGNMQLAINNSNHMTLIEPKLPSLYQCLEPSEADGSPAIVDSAHHFESRSVFHIENLESLGFQIFSRILIEDQENRFNFSRTSDPSIVGHAWSPVENCTRDCFLGVLLNTGEVMVLKRDSLDANNYSLKFRSFTCILEQMSLPQNRLTAEGNIIISGDQFSQLQVTAFSFGKCADGSLIISLAHESGEVSICHLKDGLPVLQRFKANNLVVKMLWSASGSDLYYVLQDNSVWVCAFGPSMAPSGSPVKLKEASRFLVSQIHLLENSKRLLVSDTRKLYVTSIDAAPISATLPYNHILTGLVSVENSSSHTVLLPYENGRLCLAHIDSLFTSINIQEGCPGWDSFCFQTLHKYHVQLSKEQSKAPTKTFQPYLSDSCEGQLTIHGFLSMASSGFVAVTYSLMPQNVVNHITRSRREYSVGFISLDLLTATKGMTSTSVSSTLAILSSFFMNNSNTMPRITKEAKDGNEEALANFVQQLKEWKSTRFEDPFHTKLTVVPCSSLQDSIIQNFRENCLVHELQKLYLCNISLAKLLRAIVLSSEEPRDALNQGLMAIAQEQDIISSKIRTQLASTVVNWASVQSLTSFHSTLDTFLLNTYRVVLLHSNMLLAELPIPERVKLTISTDLCTEMFEVSKQEAISDQFLKTVTSSSQHSWPRCDMTLLPILELSNKMDELECHNYLSAKRDDSYLLGVIFGCLNYCIFTGTRTFDLKIGV